LKFQAIAEKTAKKILGGYFFSAPCTYSYYKYEKVKILFAILLLADSIYRFISTDV